MELGHLESYKIGDLKDICVDMNISTKGCKTKQSYIDSIKKHKNDQENSMKRSNKINIDMIKMLPACPKLSITPKFSKKVDNVAQTVWANPVNQVFGGEPVKPVPIPIKVPKEVFFTPKICKNNVRIVESPMEIQSSPCITEKPKIVFRKKKNNNLSFIVSIMIVLAFSTLIALYLGFSN